MLTLAVIPYPDAKECLRFYVFFVLYVNFTNTGESCFWYNCFNFPSRVLQQKQT